MIANTIRVQYRAPSRDTLMYSKPYTRRMDNLQMPTGYQPPKFQHWDQMEREFLNRFYSTRRTVSMMELTNTKQRKDEPVVDYIN
ncbi:hypothetical protein L3X38_019428 [Prunus dulcis]|uniref:Retrotransposon gag domain-containing protein n=1 Tax=Prunus dulcis TaxID=3755 RepID=A0AAD4WB50_PRUDU|nr:hypothetical protein L3X38_019428 [Prunus dulcis]